MYHLFERFGIELEYMIVNRDTLDIMPVCDSIIKQANDGIIQNEIEREEINWSNELVLHVIELKTGAPVKSLKGLSEHFLRNIHEINKLLQSQNCMLLPGPMHPLMDPVADMHIWPYENSPIYSAFDRIFSCKGHGWSNLQSMHINLPFADDNEFAKLHTAIRLILPIIPALSAGSPIADGVDTGFHDYRMEVYRVNSAKIPVITGNVIPVPVFSKAEYEEKILKAIYKELAPFDPDKVLQEEWVNARGAIARFERNTIEIRIIDSQECPSADMAIAAAVTGVIQLLTCEAIGSFEYQKEIETELLIELFLKVIRDGEGAKINNFQYLKCIGMDKGNYSAGDIWKYLLGKLDSLKNGYIDPYRLPLLHIINNGTLATRILKKANRNVTPDSVLKIYKELASCLVENRMFNY